MASNEEQESNARDLIESVAKIALHSYPTRVFSEDTTDQMRKDLRARRDADTQLNLLEPAADHLRVHM